MEFNFQKTVLAIAIVIFIAILIFIAIILYNSKYNVKFPPTVSQCPDYWINTQNINDFNDLNNNIQTCINVKNLGNVSCDKIIDFSGDFWQGSTGACNKYKWARLCDLSWDGITNNPKICNTTI